MAGRARRLSACWAVGFFHRHRGLTPYLLLLPGIAWLAVFFLVPLGFLAYQSLQSGTFDVGYAFDWAWGNYWDALQQLPPLAGPLARSTRASRR